MQYKLYIFDLNGTLTNTPFLEKQDGKEPPLTALPGRAAVCKALLEQGAKLAIASNQGGVAWVHMTEDQARAEVGKIASELGIQYFRVACGMEKTKAGLEEYSSERHLAQRKPAPGMLIELMKETRTRASTTLMIGDRDEDEGAAKAAGIGFVWAKHFFGDPGELIAQIYTLYLRVQSQAPEGCHLEMVWAPGGAGAGSIRDMDSPTLFSEWNNLPEGISALTRLINLAEAWDAVAANTLKDSDLP